VHSEAAVGSVASSIRIIVSMLCAGNAQRSSPVNMDWRKLQRRFLTFLCLQYMVGVGTTTGLSHSVQTQCIGIDIGTVILRITAQKRTIGGATTSMLHPASILL
jgi:hypothetical protein